MTQKSILITGAAQGIGFTIAEMATSKGYQVAMLDLDSDTLAHSAKQLGALPLTADVTSDASINAAFDLFVAEFGVPTTVVNNAGIVRFGPLIEQSVSDFITTINVNLIGSYIVAREAALRMRTNGGGHIINMTSINSITPGPGAGGYPATKSALKQMTRQLAIELGPDKIRVNAVSPGFIDAGMSAPIYADDKVRAQRSNAVPAGRLGTAADIANAILFLDSEQASYINGHELVVDGGVVHSLLNQLPRD